MRDRPALSLEPSGRFAYFTMLTGIFDTMVVRLGEAVPDLGRHISGDSTHLSARTGRSRDGCEAMHPDGGHKEYTDKEGRCNQDKGYGLTVRVKQSLDLRRFPPIPRATRTFERLYKGRTASERVQARLKVFWGMDDGNVAGGAGFLASVGLVMVAHISLQPCWPAVRAAQARSDACASATSPRRWTKAGSRPRRYSTHACRTAAPMRGTFQHARQRNTIPLHARLEARRFSAGASFHSIPRA